MNFISKVRNKISYTYVLIVLLVILQTEIKELSSLKNHKKIIYIYIYTYSNLFLLLINNIMFNIY